MLLLLACQFKILQEILSEKEEIGKRRKKIAPNGEINPDCF